MSVWTCPRRPTNHDLLDVRLFAQTEMQAALILRPKAAATRHLLHLLLPIPEQPHLRANGAAVADAAFQVKSDPLMVRRDGILVQQQRPFLIGDHDIQHATIPEIGERHGTAIVRIRDPNRLRHVKELPGAIVEPHAFLLIARQTATFHRWPVLRIGDDRGVATRHLREIVPVISFSIRRDIAIGQIQIEVPIVVQVAKLRAKTPAAELDAHGARQIFILEVLSRRAGFRHPEVVPLQEDALFGDIRHINGKLALIENVTDRSVHATLGRKTHTRLFADFAETCATLVEIQLRDAVIVGNEQVWIPACRADQPRLRPRPSGGSVMPSCSVTSSKLPSPRLRSMYFRPPFCAYSKLSGMILVVVSFHRLRCSA